MTKPWAARKGCRDACTGKATGVYLGSAAGPATGASTRQHRALPELMWLRAPFLG